MSLIKYSSQLNLTETQEYSFSKPYNNKSAKQVNNNFR